MSSNSEMPSAVELNPDKTWPPAPSKPKAPPPTRNADGDLTHCPHCRNRLLTLKSIMCSWCGKPINDEKYLEKAAAERAAVDAAMREKLAREAQKPTKSGLIAKIATNIVHSDE